MQVDDLEKFRRNLRTVMDAIGLSQREVAEAAGISEPYLSRVLNGRSHPTMPICTRLAAAVGLDLPTLLLDPLKFSEDLLSPAA